MDLNLRVLIEPRGFIRIIQLVMTIFAFATTAGFETVATISIKCKEYAKDIQYKFGYPFKMGKSELRIPEACTANISDISFKTYIFPFDFSSNAEFFVASGVITMIYTAGIIFIYVFMHRLYSTNPMTPVVDFISSGVLSIFWFAGSCAWAQGVSDIKYYTNPTNLFHEIDICNEPEVCHTSSPGNFASLNVSLIFGFANCMLWISSLWFVYKETSFHQQVQPPAMLPQMGQQQAPPMQEEDLGPKMGGQYEY